ncbi:MAG: LamG domain-containing protein, partial [Nanoarchaeota archaeon]
MRKELIFLIFVILLIIPLVISQDGCSGCLDSGTCYNYGTKLEVDATASYCDILTNAWQARKADGEVCNNNFECLNDLCSKGRCVDLYAKAEELAQAAEGVDQESVDSGLIAHYNFEGNANDVYGINHGIAGGVDLVDGKYGQAYYFDGVDANISIPDMISSLNYFTISAWIKVDDLNSRRTILSVGNSQSITPGISFRVLSSTESIADYRSKIQLFIRDNDGKKSWVLVDYPYDSEWHHVVAVRDDSIARVYIDGIETASTGEILGLLTVDGAAIGRSKITNYTEYFKGVIDEVTLYNRALSKDEIKVIYSQQLKPKITPTWINIYGIGNLDLSDIITAYSGNLLVGKYIVNKEDRYGYMPIYIDDITTSEKDGIVQGDTIILYRNGLELRS